MIFYHSFKLGTNILANNQSHPSLSFAFGSTKILPVSSSSQKAQTSDFEVSISQLLALFLFDYINIRVKGISTSNFKQKPSIGLRISVSCSIWVSGSFFCEWDLILFIL